MALWKPDDEDEELDLTPMIDIVFLLIAFFMVVAKMIKDEKIEIEIPLAEQSKLPEEAGKRQIVTVDKNGTVYWGTTELGQSEAAAESLSAKLRTARELQPKLKVFLRADARVPHRHVRNVMDATAQGGIFDVIFAAFEVK